MKRRNPCIIFRVLSFVALFTSILAGSFAEAREIFVAKTGSDTNVGDAAHPLLTIQHAADVAYAGDTITVHAGVYRERVDPPRGGTSETQRIIYRAAPGEDVRIVGSEHVVAQWKLKGAYWQVTLPKSFFGSLNPFATLVRNPNFVHGDKNDGWGWLRYGRWVHLGDVYINGQGLTEQETDAGLSKPQTWRADVDPEGATTIKANFGVLDPNIGWVEVNVRPTLFYPSTPGLSYISVRGFTMMNAATRWTPPSVEQLGAIGPNGGNHWIIEDNAILYSRAVGISLGMPSGPADQAESGHHIVRDNVIMRCGQAGIVGESWNSNSIIARNDIEDTNYRLEFGGAETGAIKFHRAHNTVIENNFIRGVGTIDREVANGDAIWLDNGNSGNTIRNNVVTGAMGNSILMEANWVGSNVIENNIVVGGRAATYSSQDTRWKYNLFYDCQGYWVNQVDLNRPSITGAAWTRNLIIRGDMAGSPDAKQENLYLGVANARDEDPGGITGPLDPQFVFDINGAGVTATFVIDSATYRRLKDKPGEDLDFYGHPRSKDDFGFGPFANVTAGKNVMPLFRYSPRRRFAIEILNTDGVQTCL
jgi:Right handed beta helix region/Glycoside hydrolase 120, insertion domain